MSFNGEYNVYKIIINISALALAVSEILTLGMFDLENLCQGHRIQYLQWCLLMPTSILHIFSLYLTVTAILKFQNLDLENLGQDHSEHNNRSNAVRWRISPSIKVITGIFVLALTDFEILTCNILPLQFRSRSRRKTELTSFDWKRSIVYWWFFKEFSLPAIYENERSTHTHTHTQTHTHRQQEKEVTIIGKFAKQICLKMHICDRFARFRDLWIVARLSKTVIAGGVQSKY